jgi:tetratricopeptide (TPR) repeat protein
MKLKSLSALFIFLCCTGALQSASFTHEIDSLINKRAYAKAWHKIEGVKTDSSVSFIIQKSKFCLTYFAHTLYHQKFYFVNLKDNESLFDYRQKAPDTNVGFTNFNPEQALTKLRSRFSKDPKVNLALGDYYYDVYVTYGTQWKKGKEELLALFYYHYSQAYQANVKTSLSVYALSLYYQSRRTYDQSEKYLKESIEMDSTYAPAHYNLAYSYSIIDSTDKAIFHAQKAYDLYRLKNFKADAAMMIGVLLSDQRKYADAVNWLLIADAETPGNFYIYESLLSTYLHLNKKEEAHLIAKNLYNYDWRTARIFNSILESYLAVKKGNDLKEFLLEEMAIERNDEEYRGFLLLHLAQTHLRMDENIQAKDILDRAESSFRIAYDKEHGVFKVIERMNWSLKTGNK